MARQTSGPGRTRNDVAPAILIDHANGVITVRASIQVAFDPLEDNPRTVTGAAIRDAKDLLTQILAGYDDLHVVVP